MTSSVVSRSGGLVVYTWTARASFVNYAQPIRFSLLFIEGTGLDYLALGEHLWIGEAMKWMLLWKAVSLFILLHNLESSGINESTPYIECKSF